MLYEFGFYFGTPYRPALLEQVLTSFAGWLDTTVEVEALQLPPSQVTRADVDKADSQLPRPRKIRMASRDDLDHLIRTQFVRTVGAQLKKDKRPVFVHPYVYDDDTASILLGVLFKEEDLSPWPSSQVFQEFGMERMLSVLDAIDALWVAIGWERSPPSLTEVKRGTDIPPAGLAYYSRSVVEALGKRPLLEALKRSRKVVQLPRGGIFFAWAWEAGQTIEPPGAREFYAFLRSRIRAGALDHLRLSGNEI